MLTKKRIARQAGLLYLLLAITAAYGIMFAPSQVFVLDNAAATFENLRAKGFIHNLGILGHLTSQVLFIFLSIHLYRLFESTQKDWARTMVALVLVQIPVVFVIETLNVTAYMLAMGKVGMGFEPVYQQELAYLLIRTHDYGILLLSLFYGLWLAPLGLLGIQSGYFPKWIGILLVAACAAYIVDTAMFLLANDVRKTISGYLLLIPTVAELSTVFWLLIWGVKSNKTPDSISNTL